MQPGSKIAEIALFFGIFLPALVQADPSRICLPEDTQTCLILSPEAVQELSRVNNSYGEDVQIHMVRKTSEEVDRTLRSLRITATLGSGQEIPDFFFKNPVELYVGHWTLFQRFGPQDSAGSGSSYLPVGDVRQWLSLYWSNGQTSIRLGGLEMDDVQALHIPVHNLGSYQVVAARAASSLQLSRGSPYPRIVTPNGRSNRRAFFFVQNPGTDRITGTIYDFLGAKIRDLQIDTLSPAPNALVWDGRDSNGDVVPSGPYFYKISAGGQTVTGSLVVAR